MHTFAALVVLGVVGAAPLALAEAWRAKPGLEPGSPPDCKEADVSNLFFDLADTRNELSVKTSSGEAFSAPIGPMVPSRRHSRYRSVRRAFPSTLPRM
jgi:hypothetical protein